MNKKKKVVLMAAVVSMTAACGTAYAMDNDSGNSRSGGSGFCADMPDAVGLYPGNPVTQMGFRIGKVDSVAPEGTSVQVKFSIDGGRSIPADVKAVTRSKSLLADRSLELVGNYTAGPQLKSGNCIALDHSYTPKSISEITGSAADFINAMTPSNNRQSLQNAITGFDRSLRGNGQDAATMMQHASAAMQSPDQLVSDIGSSIENMAPLTDQALQRWSTIESILNQAPDAITNITNGLVPGVNNVVLSVGWLTNMLNDIQHNYGGLIWPLMHGGVTQLIHLAATRSNDIAGLLDSIPSVAAFLRQQSGPGGLTVAYRPPTVRVGNSTVAASTSLLDLVLAKGNR